MLLDFLHEYLLGDEIKNEKYSYEEYKKKNDLINWCDNYDWKEKRLIINGILKNCMYTNNNVSHEQVKKHIAYVLYRNRNYLKYINNDIIFDENFLNFYFNFIMEKKKKNFSKCLYYNMTNESLFLIFKSLYIKKKDPQYIQCVETITNLFICKYIEYKCNNPDSTYAIKNRDLGGKLKKNNATDLDKPYEHVEKNDYVCTNVVVRKDEETIVGSNCHNKNDNNIFVHDDHDIVKQINKNENKDKIETFIRIYFTI
ncbi:conserved protein, unknown function, partial [Hepatocystis sp. ex Piliocolobus tephrosceles]